MLTCEFDVRPPVDPRFADNTSKWMPRDGLCRRIAERDFPEPDFSTTLADQEHAQRQLGSNG